MKITASLFVVWLVKHERKCCWIKLKIVYIVLIGMIWLIFLPFEVFMFGFVIHCKFLGDLRSPDPYSTYGLRSCGSGVDQIRSLVGYCMNQLNEG